MLMKSFGDFGTGKFSIRHSRHIPIPVRVTIFPHSWLSSCGKKQILHERRIVTCTGIGMCLSWLIENFKIPPLAASPLVEEFSRPKIAKWLHWYNHPMFLSLKSFKNTSFVWKIGFGRFVLSTTGLENAFVARKFKFKFFVFSTFD